jgi:hypothetical protein
MKKTILPILFMLIVSAALAQETAIKYLSGTDKDHTVQWDFFCTGGRNSNNGQKLTSPLTGNCRVLAHTTTGTIKLKLTNRDYISMNLLPVTGRIRKYLLFLKDR